MGSHPTTCENRCQVTYVQNWQAEEYFFTLVYPLQSRAARLGQPATRLAMLELSSLSKTGIFSGRLGLCRTAFFWKWRFWRINEVPKMVGYDPTLRDLIVKNLQWNLR